MDWATEAEARIGYQFNDKSLLELALLHASAADQRVASNERLEFLGDAVLGVVACERIFARFPSLLEGDMTKIKSTAVSRRTCAKLARDLGLDEMLVLGKGVREQGDLPSSLAAAVFESVTGAIYVDGGLDAARAFLYPMLDPLIDAAEASGHQQNFKSVLQQHCQQRLGITPYYRALDEKGPDHAKAFKIAVEVGSESFEPAWGQSKKQAEQQAALLALLALRVVASDGNGGFVVLADASAVTDDE